MHSAATRREPMGCTHCVEVPSALFLFVYTLSLFQAKLELCCPFCSELTFLTFSLQKISNIYKRIQKNKVNPGIVTQLQQFSFGQNYPTYSPSIILLTSYTSPYVYISRDEDSSFFLYVQHNHNAIIIPKKQQ